jgi:CheY-like chemotaxis protein
MMATTGKTILLVEDDRFLRRACEASLRQRGFTVITAVDGEEALTRVREHMPDLVLLDLLMPKIAGIEVLKALKSDVATKAIPVLILSNSSREQDVSDVMQLGAVAYWVKANLSLKELGERVARLLDGDADAAPPA